MKLDLSKPYDLQKARTQLEKLIKDQAKIELKRIRSNTKSMNIHRYAHVCMALFGGSLGYKIDESKELFKREFAKAFPEIATYQKNGETFIKSFKNGEDNDPTLFHRLECEKFIDWIRETADNHGYYIPSSEEYNKSAELQWEIEKELEHIL